VTTSAIANLLRDPPPSHAFELSEAGVAFARILKPPQLSFEPLAPGVLNVSPVHDNVQQPDALAERIQALALPATGRRRRAALILPDYSARVAVLDFDAFPDSREEQQALVRFRMKKSVPFDVESALVSYYAQAKNAKARKIEVVVAVVAFEILARYEAPLRAAGFQPGFITTSALSALNLLDPNGVALLAKLSGRILTVLVLDERTLKLVRCVEMDLGTPDEIDSILIPTLAYVEDELGTTPKRIFLCGFGSAAAETARRWEAHSGAGVETLRSRFGEPGAADAGLLGYLEGQEASRN
jgi:type IV pilus assembly protein PilM